MLAALGAIALHLTAAAHAEIPRDCAQFLPFGEPITDATNLRYSCHPGYLIAYNDGTLSAAWVAWAVTADQASGTLTRSGSWKPDLNIPADVRLAVKDWPAASPRPKNCNAARDRRKPTCFDKGHMAPSADFKNDADLMADTFTMSNALPQLHALNAGVWKQVEDRERAWALTKEVVYIIAGPTYEQDVMKPLGKREIPIPSGYWKTIYDAKGHQSMTFHFAYDDVARAPTPDDLVRMKAVKDLAGVELPKPEGLRESNYLWATE